MAEIKSVSVVPTTRYSLIVVPCISQRSLSPAPQTVVVSLVPSGVEIPALNRRIPALFVWLMAAKQR